MTEKQIFDYLVSLGFTKEGTAGLMGNLKAESNLNPRNLQNTSEKKLNLTDDEYTEKVDNGSYTNFVHDSAGYGLAQWTFWSRKQDLLNFAKNNGYSIGDYEMQLKFLYKELITNRYQTVFDVLTTTSSIKEASDVVLTGYEKPANQSEAVKQTRLKYGQEIYTMCTEGVEEKMTEAQARNKVVTVAKTYLGYSEANAQDDIIIKKYNSIKSEGMYEMKMADSWCAAFASVVGNVAGFSNIIPIECSCERMIELFKNLGRWEEDGTTVPKIGDYIFYNWDDATQPNDGWADHVGIIVSVSGKTIKVIEGNYNDEVGYRTISVGWGYIRGYGRPDYASVASADTVSVPDEYSIGDVVSFKGNTHYTSSYSTGVANKCTSGKAQITAMSLDKPHPYHLVGIDGSSVYGWVNANDISGKASAEGTTIKKGDKVTVKNALTYAGKSFKVWYEAYDVIEVSGDRIVIGQGSSATCAINISNISKA